MKYLGTILVAYIVLFILDIMQKRNHKTTKSFYEIFCENWQNPVKQRITPHFLTTRHSNYYEFTTKE